MRILTIGENQSGYIAKCHEAFKTGLSRRLGATRYGPGYPNYDPSIETCKDLFAHIGFEPDAIFVQQAIVSGLKSVDCFKFGVVGDYWSLDRNSYEKSIQSHGINMVMVYFKQALQFLEGMSEMCWVPACFDSDVFNHRGQDREYDVGFLAAGVSSPSPFYPERMAIHQQLMLQPELRYLHRPHPGWGNFADDHPLVGRGFSKAIGSCRIFITTGGRYRTANSKYVEAIASGSLLAADNPEGSEEMGFRSGYNYLEIPRDDPKEAVSRITDLLVDHEKFDKIHKSGVKMIQDNHSCEKRAEEFDKFLKEIIG